MVFYPLRPSFFHSSVFIQAPVVPYLDHSAASSLTDVFISRHNAICCCQSKLFQNSNFIIFLLNLISLMFPCCLQDKVHTFSHGTRAIHSSLFTCRDSLPCSRSTLASFSASFAGAASSAQDASPTPVPDHPYLFLGFLFTVTC